MSLSLYYIFYIDILKSTIHFTDRTIDWWLNSTDWRTIDCHRTDAVAEALVAEEEEVRAAGNWRNN